MKVQQDFPNTGLFSGNTVEQRSLSLELTPRKVQISLACTFLGIDRESLPVFPSLDTTLFG